jgi:hypothetical protein
MKSFTENVFGNLIIAYDKLFPEKTKSPNL